MSLTYTGGTGIFTNIGAVIAAINECGEHVEDFDTRLDLIQDSFELAEMQTAEAPLIGYVTQAQQSLANAQYSMANLATLRLQDFASVVQVLGIPSSDMSQVIPALISQMVLDTASVDASTVTIGSVTAAAANVGNGTILVDRTLDGYSIPIGGGISHPAYLGRLTELSITETMKFVVILDSYADGQTSGQESLIWNGQPGLIGTWSLGEEGSGQGPGLSTLQAGTILENMGFETWTVTNTADNWTLDTGTIATNFAQQTSGANVYRGSYSAKFIGTGAAASISITQPISATRVKPMQRYCCSIRYKASGTDGEGVAFTVKLTGTGYSEGSTERIVVAGGSLPTSWTLGYFYVNLPAVIPSDLNMSISFTGTPAVTIYVDDLGFSPVVWHNGVNAVAIAGATPFVKGDSWTVAITNDQASTFNEFFRRAFKVQLPSSSLSAETISDALAEG